MNPWSYPLRGRFDELTIHSDVLDTPEDVYQMESAAAARWGFNGVHFAITDHDEFHEITTVSYDDKGKRIENVTFAEVSTLRGVQISANDMDDVRVFR